MGHPASAGWLLWIRLLLFGIAVLTILLWPRAVAPDLSERRIQQVVGRYACQRWPLSARSDRVDGVRYVNDFGHVFGYGNASFCIEELNGRQVVVRFVETPSPNPRLLLSLRDAVTGTVWGASEAERLERMRTYLAQPWMFQVWKGLALLVLASMFFPRIFRRARAAIARFTRLSD